MRLQRAPERGAGAIDAWPGLTGDRHRTPLAPAPKAVLDRMLELLERRRLSPAELRILVAVLDRDVAVSTLAETFDRPSVEVRRTAARLYARGLLAWRNGRGSEDAVFAITPAGLATVRPLLTTTGQATQ